MIITYKDNLSTISKNIIITEELVSEFFHYKNIPDSLKEFYSVNLLEQDEEFKNWYIENYVKSDYISELNDIKTKLYRSLLKSFIEQKGWKNISILDKLVISLKYSYTGKYNIDWREIRDTFYNLFINVCFTGDPEKYYNKQAEIWGVK